MITGKTLQVKGPKGTLSYEVNARAQVVMGEEGTQKTLRVEVPDSSDSFGRSIWGTTRANIANLVKGVTEGFTKSLEVNGVGYRVAVQGQKIVLEVGYSHDVEVPIPTGITATVEKNVLTLGSADKVALGQFSAQVRSVRKPEPYGGKGIKYTTETIRRKAGKAAKTAE